MIRSFKMGDSENALLHVAAIVDPISEQTQKWSSLLKVSAKSWWTGPY
jgi:UDP-glucose:glycoprotein glucosyltransferase